MDDGVYIFKCGREGFIYYIYCGNAKRFLPFDRRKFDFDLPFGLPRPMDILKICCNLY